MKPLCLHNLTQVHSCLFKVDGLKVQYAGTDNTWTQYIFNDPINHNQNGTFKIKVTRSQSNQIMIGVIDYAKQKDER